MSFEARRNMITTLFELTLLNVLVLGLLIYDGSRMWIAISAVWALLVAFFFGFALGNLRVPEER